MKKHVFVICFLLLRITSDAQKVPIPQQFGKTQLSLIENKGQITDQYGQPRNDIQFKTGGNGVSVFVGSGQLHYQFSKANNKTGKAESKKGLSLLRERNTTAATYSMYRLDMTLDGANSDAKMIADDKQAYYETYYTTALHSNAPAANYGKVTYKDIYPNIDWVLYIKDGRLEYDFVVRPGGNVTDIQIRYGGATGIAHTAGNIKVTTPTGDVREEKLYAYEQGSGKHIAARFCGRGNCIGFKAAHDKHATIVIDPTLSWGTYFGGSYLDETSVVTYDPSGYLYVTGLTQSVSNIATTGAYQTNLSGSDDAFLAKFTTSGALLWGTYFGGNDYTQGLGVCCDRGGSVYIAGSTSSTNISTPGAMQTTYGGGYRDAFLAKFTTSGVLVWATYYGGDSNDIAKPIICDTACNIYMAGATGSIANIATAGAHQTAYGGGDGDVFLVKFDSSGNRIWGTYFGGSSDDEPGLCGIVYDARADIVYISGSTKSSDRIASTGAWQSSWSGGYDVFLAKFHTDGSIDWSTYYGGAGDDGGGGIAVNSSSEVFVSGNTYSTVGIATAGTHQSVNGGSCDAFLAKFDSSGNLKWGTYYGGSEIDGAENVACDPWGNLFISGFTGSAAGIVTSSTYQGELVGTKDIFLAEFDNDGGLQWGTYYGGIGNNSWGVVTLDMSGNAYVTGYTTSSNNIATVGSHQDTLGGESDVFLAKFSGFPDDVLTVEQGIQKTTVYPSPNNGSFTVDSFLPGYNGNAGIDVINDKGEVVYSTTVFAKRGVVHAKIKLSSTRPGIYTMRIIADSRRETTIFTIIN